MKVFFTLFAVLAIFLAAYPFVFDTEGGAERLTGLPWQIEVGADGGSRVFGIAPGSSSFAEVIAVLGDDAELAIVAAKGETGTLEMYFGHYRSGLISGKMILQAAVSPDLLEHWKQTAVKVDYMPSGMARKYILDSDELPAILESVVQNITFIPAVNLDEETILARFGTPEERMQINEQLTHYLYPALGLDIALSGQQKDVLQYVTPADFERLRTPLYQQSSDH